MYDDADQKIAPRTCTVREAAKQLGISDASAYEAARTGDLPTIKIGKRILVPLAALDKKLQAA